MNKALRVLTATVLLSLATAGPVMAGDHAQAEEAHASGDHWSVLSAVLPATAVHNLQGLLGTTYIAKEPVAKIAHVFMAALVFVLLIGMALAANRRMKGDGLEEAIAPPPRFTVLTFFEIIFGAAYATMSDMMGEANARRYFPLIGGLAFFILLSNLLGSIPGFLPPTDNWNTTLALGLVVFLTYNFFGFREHGLSYLNHFFGPIRKWYALPLMLFMFLIEMIGHVVRPMSLSIRLMGNIFGDHTVLAIFLGFHLLLVPIPVQVLGLLVAVVQTFVFCLLSVAYISMAVAEEDH